MTPYFQRNLVAQTGDPTGTGKGGESIFRSVIFLVSLFSSLKLCFGLCNEVSLSERHWSLWLVRSLIFDVITQLCRILYGEQAKYFEMETKPRIKHKKKGTVSMVNNGGDMHGSQVRSISGSLLRVWVNITPVKDQPSRISILSHIHATICVVLVFHHCWRGSGLLGWRPHRVWRDFWRIWCFRKIERSYSWSRKPPLQRRKVRHLHIGLCSTFFRLEAVSVNHFTPVQDFSHGDTGWSLWRSARPCWTHTRQITWTNQGAAGGKLIIFSGCAAGSGEANLSHPETAVVVVVAAQHWRDFSLMSQHLYQRKHFSCTQWKISFTCFRAVALE